MPGFSDFDPSAASLDMPMVALVVYRLTTDETNEGGSYELLPNIVPLRVEKRVGAQPGRAVLSYILDPSGSIGDPDWPSTPEDVLDPKATGPYILAQDDRVVIFGITDGGDPRIVFDGFAQAPRARMGGAEAKVELYAMGTPIRCADKPVWGRLERDADDPEDGLDTLIDLRVVFNPDGQPNATDEGHDGKLPWDDKVTTPTFLDPLVCFDRQIGRKWSLAMAVHYLLAACNDETWVDNGILSSKDELLDGRKPLEDGGDIDPADPATYTSAPIALKEFDATGMPWPVVVETLLAAYGFRMIFALSQGDDLMPKWSIRIFRAADDDPLSYKQVYLQDYGSDLDLARTNALSFGLERDAESVENEVIVYGRPDRYEASLVLAPGFVVLAADATDPTKFDLVDSADLSDGGDDDRDQSLYRDYVFDEAGDGHTGLADGDWTGFVEGPGEATSLVSILGGPKGTDESAYAKRRRPPRREIFTADQEGKPRHSLLLLSTDYEGPVPGVWDGSGDWYEAGSAWRLLDDRLGIRLTAKSVEGWQTGNKAISFGVNLMSSGGIVKGVSAQAVAGETRFVLMLTTVFEGDTLLNSDAKKRAASPSKFAVKKYVDGHDRYRLDTIVEDSWWNFPTDPAVKPADILSRDDTKDADFEAAQVRAEGEMPPMSGPIALFGLVNTYDLGDRITSIDGRSLSLQTNAKGDGEGTMYPLVVQVDYDLDGKQETILHLSDQRLHRGERR